MSKKTLVVIGHLAIDEIISKSGESRIYGGAALYAAIGARSVADKVYLVSRVGSDYDLKYLKSLPIKNYVKIENGKSPHFTLTYSGKNTREVIKDSYGVGNGICFSDIPKDILNHSFVHICNMPPEQQLKIAKDLVRNKVSFSFHSHESYFKREMDIILRILEAAKFFIVDEKEYELLNLNSSKIILTEGPKGSSYPWLGLKSKNPKVKFKNKNGAGDVFTGAFIANYIKTENIQTSLELATRVSAYSVEDMGVIFENISKKIKAENASDSSYN